MRAVPMSFSILQIPKYGICTLANFCNESFYRFSGSYEYRSNHRLLCSKTYGVEGGYSKRWTRRPISTNTEGQNQTVKSSKTVHIKKWTATQMFPENAVYNRKTVIHEDQNTEGKNKTAKSSRSVPIKTDTPPFSRKTLISEPESIQFCGIQELIAQNIDFSSLVTVIVFDIETTGLSRKDERIIEIALQDLSGGENSTFHTLVNPGRSVPNPHVHGISTNMVCRAGVPSMAELIPILLEYAKSRQKPGGYTMFAAHNARAFDVPFLIKEFTRHSYEIPPSWLFMDTLALARDMMKSGGSKLPSGLSLQALREFYEIPLVGSAHRAMSDVNTLSLILQRLTYDLKLPMSGLVGKSFTVWDVNNPKKKKK